MDSLNGDRVVQTRHSTGVPRQPDTHWLTLDTVTVFAAFSTMTRRELAVMICFTHTADIPGDAHCVLIVIHHALLAPGPSSLEVIVNTSLDGSEAGGSRTIGS